ncbi:D(1) dopamine receptor-like [Diadema setosum]|uniref:D(1) dopamine receptor-like n=1 Tax=Diadema setosum TaxID=31175 RepID=UPI003B3B07F1
MSTTMVSNVTDSPENAGGYSLGAVIVIAIILYFIVVLAIAGNVLVISSVLIFRKLRTVTNYFIVSLAIADLMVALFVMDFNATFIVLGYWPFGLTFCNIYISIDILLCTASILNLCIISVDRYWAITSPFSYYQRVNAKNAIILIVAVWVVSFLISVLPVNLGLHKDKELSEEEFENAYNNPTFCVLTLSRWYALGSSIISFFIPTFIIGYTYARIFVVARRQARQIAAYNNTGQRIQGMDKKSQGSMRRERKATKTLAIIVGVFICCWLLFFILNIIEPFCHCIPVPLFDVAVWLGYINSALNPIIYAQNKSFRNAFKTILLCYKCRGMSMRQADSSDDQTAMSNTSRQERLRERQANGLNKSPRPSNSDHRSSVENSVEHTQKLVKDTSLVIINKNASENTPAADVKKDATPPVSVATITHPDSNGNALTSPL